MAIASDNPDTGSSDQITYKLLNDWNYETRQWLNYILFCDWHVTWLKVVTFLHRTTSVRTRSSREWRYSLKIRYIVQPCSYYIIDLCVILSELPVSGLSPHLHKCWPSPLLYPMIPLPFIHIHYHTELSHIFILQLFTTNIFLDFSFTHKFTHFLITKITIYIKYPKVLKHS